MSLRIRGQEVVLRLAIDGAAVEGSMFKVNDFTVTPRQELQEADYIGEDVSDLDVMHNGYDLAWSIDMQDAVSIDLIDDIAKRNEGKKAPQDVTLTVIYTFREPGAGGRVVVYHDMVLKVDEEGASGRKERVKTKISAKAKRRETLEA